MLKANGIYELNIQVEDTRRPKKNISRFIGVWSEISDTLVISRTTGFLSDWKLRRTSAFQLISINHPYIDLPHQLIAR